MNKRIACCFLLVLNMAWAGCANISTPTGGKRDKTPPKLMSVSPADSLKGVKVKRVELNFDEYVTVGDVSKEVELQPILAVAPTVTGVNKHVVVKIVDSLLEDNTTYRLSFGNAIKDLHEGNAFRNYTYVFSTGSYFDSLQLKGNVIDAATGLPDTSGVIVVLYNSTENDTAIVKKKPKYVARVDGRGAFNFKGLPARSFRIYAVKDGNTNLIYDGEPEMVAFNDETVMPGTDTVIHPLTLRLFTEITDTSVSKKSKDKAPSRGSGLRKNEQKPQTADTNLTYTTNIDTSSTVKRSFNINKPVKFIFNKPVIADRNKVLVSYDSTGIIVHPLFELISDTAHRNEVLVKTSWVMNKVYTIRIDSAFVTDTAGKANSAARFAFRTNNEDDYGKIELNIPSKYMQHGGDVDYVLQVKADEDTVFQKAVHDTVVKLPLLRPASYTFRIIADKNKNGKWDTGDLLGRKQPEEVIPSSASVKLRAGFEHLIDFEDKAKPKSSAPKGGARDKTTPK